MNRLVKEKFFSKGETEEIFKSKALLLDSRDVIPCYRVIEMFGEWTRDFIKEKLKLGNDYNAWGNCESERPLIYYLYKSGFFKVVAERNYLLMKDEIKRKEIKK